MSISAQMRDASAQDHKTAESMHFIKHLMEGQLSAADYARYLNQLAFIYQALERHLQTANEMPFAQELLRFERIVEDLEALGVDDWQATTVLPATAAYVARLSGITGLEDVRLVAHHYTRYLGDLSGGQAIAALVRRHYGLTDAQTGFYGFDQIENLVRFKEDYRSTLDGLNLTSTEIAALTEEVRLAFRLNQSLFQELGDLAPAL
jgi:heme oxygenase